MATLHGKKIKLFSLNSNLELAQEIADYINVPLSKCEINRFSDGEVQVNIEETVRGHIVFVIQSTNAPVNDNYMELLIMIDALKRASAEQINIIMPYYGYSRQDRKAAPRQPISAKLMADLLQVAGASRLMCLDLHGGTTRARKLAMVLDAPMAIIDKRRPRPNVAEVMNVIGEVEGKNCIIIDDMIDTAGTVSVVVKTLKERGAKTVRVCCTHALLSGAAVERLNNAPLEQLVVTNTAKLTEDKNI